MARETTLVDIADTLRAMADDIIALDARADAMEEALRLADEFLKSIQGHGSGGISSYDVAAEAVRAALNYAPLRAPRASRPDDHDATPCETCAHVQTCEEHADMDIQIMGCTCHDKWAPTIPANE